MPKLDRTLSLAAVLGAVALVAPLVAPNDYVVGVLARICLYATLALGLNVVVGFAGLLDIGYVAFFGIGSYLYAFLASPHFGVLMARSTSGLILSLRKRTEPSAITKFAPCLLCGPPNPLGEFMPAVGSRQLTG